VKIKRNSLINLILVTYILSAVVSDDGSTIMQIARLILMGVFVITLIRRNRIKIYAYEIWLFLFWIFAGLSCFWAESQSYALAMSKTLGISALCMTALIYLIDFQKEKIEVVLKTCVIAPILLEMRVIISGGLFAFLTSRSFGSISGNTVGLCASFGSCIAVYFWITKRNRELWAFLYIVNLIIVLLSSSRKALLCAFLPLGIVYILNNKDNIVIKGTKVVFVVIAIIIGYMALIKIPFLYSTVGNRIESMFALLLGNTSSADGSAITRFNLIAWGMEWFKQSPWIGYGIDNYRIVLHGYHPDYPLGFYAHNNYVELLVDVGLIGFVLYYWNYLLIIFRAIKYRKIIRNEEILCVGMIIALMINEYGLVSYYDKYIQILFLIIWVVVYNIKKRGKLDYIKNQSLKERKCMIIASEYIMN